MYIFLSHPVPCIIYIRYLIWIYSNKNMISIVSRDQICLFSITIWRFCEYCEFTIESWFNDNVTKRLSEGHLDFRKAIFDNYGFSIIMQHMLNPFINIWSVSIWSLCFNKPFFWKSMVWQWLPVEYTPKNQLPVVKFCF